MPLPRSNQHGLILGRDSTKYRTPYAPWGGFTNGYEGNLRACLMKTPDVLFGNKKQSLETNGSTDSDLQHTPVPSSGPTDTVKHSPVDTNLSIPADTETSVGAASSSVNSSPSGPNILQTASGPFDPDSVLTKLHPAIRAQYAAMLQRKQVCGQHQGRVQTPDHPPPEQQHSPAPVATSRSPWTPQHVHHTATSKAVTPVQPPHESQPQSHVPQEQARALYPLAQQIQQHAPTGSPQTSVVGPGRTPGLGPSPTIRKASPQQLSGPSTPSAQQRPPILKQTPVPPPRPWEQLQRSVPSISMQPPQPAHPAGAVTLTEAGPLQPASSKEGHQPTNVSGPLWQTLPQTMPNSNSLSPQPSFDPFQFINFQ